MWYLLATALRRVDAPLFLLFNQSTERWCILEIQNGVFQDILPYVHMHTIASPRDEHSQTALPDQDACVPMPMYNMRLAITGLCVVHHLCPSSAPWHYCYTMYIGFVPPMWVWWYGHPPTPRS